MPGRWRGRGCRVFGAGNRHVPFFGPCPRGVPREVRVEAAPCRRPGAARNVPWGSQGKPLNLHSPPVLAICAICVFVVWKPVYFTHSISNMYQICIV